MSQFLEEQNFMDECSELVLKFWNFLFSEIRFEDGNEQGTR